MALPTKYMAWMEMTGLRGADHPTITSGGEMETINSRELAELIGFMEREVTITSGPRDRTRNSTAGMETIRSLGLYFTRHTWTEAPELTT